jgi:hypothetical protein
MKKLLFGMLLLPLIVTIPIPAIARVDVSINIGLPPIVFAAPPDVIPLPDTNGVYVVPDVAVDLFFWNGWWWRLWADRWYYSTYYDGPWAYYNHIPSFYYDVDPGWRRYYRDHTWHGHGWNYERIPPLRLQQNWRSWEHTRHWEQGQRTWGVQGYQPRPYQERQNLRQQRQQQYHQSNQGPGMEQSHPQRQGERPQYVQPPRQQFQPQRQEQRPQGRPQYSQPQGGHGGGEREHKR